MALRPLWRSQHYPRTGLLVKEAPELRPVVTEIRARCCEVGERPPSYHAVQRRIPILFDDLAIAKGRSSNLAHARRLKARPGYISANGPLDIGQIDHTPADIQFRSRRSVNVRPATWQTASFEGLSQQMTPKVGGLRSFATARRSIAGFRAMLCLRKDLGFAGGRSAHEQNELLARCFGLQKVNEASKRATQGTNCAPGRSLGLALRPTLRTAPAMGRAATGSPRGIMGRRPQSPIRWARAMSSCTPTSSPTAGAAGAGQSTISSPIGVCTQ